MQSSIPTAMDLLMLLLLPPMLLLLPPMLRVMPMTNKTPPKILPNHNDDSDVSSKATDNKEAELNNDHHERKCRPPPPKLISS